MYPLKRKPIKPKNIEFIAYDFETTNIKVGTPDPLYLTSYGRNGNFKLSQSLNSWEHLSKIIIENLLTDTFIGSRFIGWNANRFDAYFIARSIVLFDDRFIVRPYMTRSKKLRGMRVCEKNNDKVYWEFLDAMAMTGLDSVGMKLKKFLSLFASDFGKLDLDFSKESFDPNNMKHVQYAERDSEGLYRAFQKANSIVKDLTGSGFTATLGNLAIKYFQSQLPENVLCWSPFNDSAIPLYGPLKRGGYCWIQKKHHGPVWKYDLNQAYAAAMRDCKLPAGRCIHTTKFVKDKCGIYHVTLSRKDKAVVPFYYRNSDDNSSNFSIGVLSRTWINSDEFMHLEKDNWTIEIMEGFYWEESFVMSDMVNTLEKLRFSDPQGPSGPLGIIVKTLGNSAYGKTLEQTEGVEIIMSKECPDGFVSYRAEEQGYDHIFCRLNEPYFKPYHCPQIGIFITAHVRIIVREAALLNPNVFLYADTDCIAFSQNMDNFLDIDPRRYGAWKKENNGETYIILGKKIYKDMDELSNKDGEFMRQKAKGLNVKNLTDKDYLDWYYNNKIPEQRQLQRNNFVKFLSGDQMFRNLDRKGTDIGNLKTVKIVDGVFNPV